MGKVITLENLAHYHKKIKEQLNKKQDVISAAAKLNADLVDDSSSNNKFVSAADKTTWNGKQDALTSASDIQLHNVTVNTLTYNELIENNSNIIKINSEEDLLALQTQILAGNSQAGKTIIITKDLDMTDLNFDGLGDNSHPFSGNVDGQGHTVILNQNFTGTQVDSGGFIQLLGLPNGGMVTIKNLKVTGIINITPSSGDSANTHGGFITGTKSGASGTGACVLNIENCISTTRINIYSGRVQTVGGFIAWIGHQDGYLAPTTININSCVWGGYLNAGAATADWGGFIGNTGLNKTNRNVTINIKNCVSAGKIGLNVAWSDNTALFIGNQKSNSSTGITTVNVENTLCIAQFVSSIDLNANNWFAYFNKQDDSHGVLNIKNFYYYQHNCRNITPIPLTPSNAGAPAYTSNVIAKTSQEMKDLTYVDDWLSGNDWLKDTDWVILKGVQYPCPKSLFQIFQTQSCLRV